jgi:hypothetical protein
VAITNGYCTLQQLRDHFGDSGASLPTSLLERAINAASREIDEFCGRRFWIDETVQTRLYRPEFDDLVWVDDIATRTGLVIKTDSTGDGTYATTWATTDYELQPLNADVNGGAYCWTRIAAVGRYRFPTTGQYPGLQLIGKGGWSAEPPEVEQACIIRSAALVKRFESPFGVAGAGEFGVMRISRRDVDVYALLHSLMRLDVGAV